MALIADRQFTRAKEVLQPLLATVNSNTDNNDTTDTDAYQYLIMAQADIAIGLGKHQEALQLTQTTLKNSPSTSHLYALNTYHSRLQASLGNHSQAAMILKQLTKKRPQDPYLWYHLAEFAGLLTRYSDTASSTCRILYFDW